MIIFLPCDFVAQNIFYFLQLYKMCSCNTKHRHKQYSVTVFAAVFVIQLNQTEQKLLKTYASTNTTHLAFCYSNDYQTK